MKNKVTKVQERVLAMMIEFNCTVHVHSGRGYHSAFFGHPCPHEISKSVRPRTVYTLIEKGLIENTPGRPRHLGRKCRLTESGRIVAEEILAMR